MQNRINRYVALVTVAAVAAAAALVVVDPSISASTAQAVLLLSGLAFVAEMLSVVLSRSVSGSVAFIPYLAAIIVAPNWLSLFGVTFVKTIFERKREPLKALFNIALYAFTFALTVLFYRAVGGVPLPSLRALSLLDVSKRIGVQSLLAIIFSVGVNSILVSGVISASTGKKARVIWRENHLSTIGLDIIAAPVIFVFAWVYVAFGAIAAATIWVPILGLRQVHKANLELERTNRELLELMIKSIEARDPYTSGHSRRVHLYSLAIARSLGLSERTIERVGRAALLHDVGKIHEKYAPILRNPNRLSPDDWLVMKEHPADGAALVGTLSSLRDVVGIVRSHHEKWDGTGYPDGIAGVAIPQESRIIGFADTIDAMMSERPYRSALGEDQVRSEIVRCRGTQFDPELADRILAPAVWSILFPARPQARGGSGLTLVGRSQSQVAGA